MLKYYTRPALACIAMSLSSCTTLQTTSQSPPANASSEIENPMLTILTSADPEIQLMGLILTRAALQRGKTPRILLCSAAGDLALASPPEAAVAPLAPKGASPHGLLKTLIAEGVKVEICAIYLPNRSHSQADLLSEVGVATPPDIASAFSAPDATILTF